MSELSQAIRAAVQFGLDQVHTAIPGEVVAYDPELQRARVKPLVARVYADGTTLELPIIPNVPVLFPRTAAGSLSFKVARGDSGLLVFSEASLERWKSLGGAQTPGPRRRFDLTDGVFLPGLYPFRGAAPNAAHADALLEAGAAAVALDAGEAVARGGRGRLRLTDTGVDIGMAGGDTLLRLLAQLIQDLQMLTVLPSTYALNPATVAALGLTLVRLQAITASEL